MIKNILCLLGFHKWEKLRWMVDRSAERKCKLLVFVKRCKKCRAIKRDLSH